MASLTQSLVRPAAFTTQQRRAARGGRRLQCRASAEEDNKQLDFTSNNRAALGFTESDSAGQTNIFAVEPKSYVAGSTADTTGSGYQATLLTAGVAAIAAAAAVAGGLLTNSGPSELAALAPAEGVKPLSAYSQQFAAELGGVHAAPAVVDSE
ncbi:hypothetical protein C2E20_7752 [Micractinium conductrix]|uniref:Uncharacterized protein n=1 Tax=Micractinium conductrix TaxID=554055 RepID=A0A2P6V3M2_9CHLO|nr:hypothetical protein C2E20_7752 [Micractinium conductrix]|eukprot:PSC68693.1 hypothetical protein C2E20_7752 [Micractinium conductrix]